VHKHVRILIPLVLLVSLSLACGLNPLRSNKLATAVPATLEALVEEEVGGGEEAEPTLPPTSGEEGAEELELSSVTSGLENLDSYVTFLEIVTLQGGVPSPTGTLQMEIYFVREPRAERVVMRGGEAGEAMEMVQIGDQQYITFGEGQCMSSQAEAGDTLGTEEMQPDDLVSGVQGARRVLPDEVVNGILCRHYTFDEKALTGSGYTRAQGEAWVAVDGDYVVKYTVEAEGKDPATGTEGQFRMRYELREVNSDLVIEPPAGCEAAGGEFPMMADATGVTTMSGMLLYESASPLADVVAFYQAEMPAGLDRHGGDLGQRRVRHAQVHQGRQDCLDHDLGQRGDRERDDHLRVGEAALPPTSSQPLCKESLWQPNRLISCASTPSERWRWTRSSKPTRGTPACRWAWRMWPTCCGRASSNTIRPTRPGPTATASSSPPATARCCSTACST